MTTQPSTLFADMPQVRADQVVRAEASEAAADAARRLAARGELTESYVRTLRWIWRWPDLTYRQIVHNVRTLLGQKCAEQEPARRFSLLVEAGLIVETGRVRCPIGGTNCTTHHITPAGIEFLRDRDAAANSKRKGGRP